MRHETAIAAAMKKASAPISHMQAYTLAMKMLRAAGDRRDAVPAVLKDFLAAITADEDLLRGCALGFLQFVARDMKGGATGQTFIDAQAGSASALPHDRDGADHSGYDAQASTVRPVREPSASQRAAAGLARLKMAESVLQTFRVRDGRAIGRIYRSEISGLIGENWRESAILDRLRGIPLPDGKNDARVDEYVSDVQMRRIIAEVDRAAA